MARINDHSHRVIADAVAKSDSALMKAGHMLERRAKTLLSKGGGRNGEPSAPGEPPHLQTGALRSSVHTAKTKKGTVVVGPTEEYGAKHEFGLRNYPPRPFMRPAFREIESDIKRVW